MIGHQSTVRSIVVFVLGGGLASFASGQDPPAAHGAEDGAEIPPKVAEPSSPPAGIELTVKSFAPAGMSGHPISLAIDERNRVFAAETNRYTVGVKQSRGDAEMEDLELEARSVEEFKEFLRQQLGKGKFRRDDDPSNADPAFCLHEGLADEVAVYEDADGDGVADRRQVFAGGFDDWYSGPGADVFCLNGDVWYTNIPDLWRLRDGDGDGTAAKSERRVVATGFGVVYSFLGHDMHGLVLGPDGRIYWSIGDRSYAVTTAEGRSFAGKMGAVFRCNRDGSDLESFATGLRNPQDLAFNAWGDLMTGDNNCDKGDSARVLRIVEGSDFGWRLPPQRAESGGPWMREFTWQTLSEVADYLKLPGVAEVLKDPTKPAWTLPPLFHPVGQGPSGACFYPGAGLPERYRDHFFLTHCAGGGGLIQSFRFADDGAGSRVEDFHVFLEEDRVVGPSDAIFGYDGKLYCTNWGSGWELNKDSSIEAVWHEASLADAATATRIQQVKRLFAEGFGERPVAELASLLADADFRVRLYAQLALVDRGPEGAATLTAVIRDVAAAPLSRFHAVHGLGQAYREKHVPLDLDALTDLRRALDDADAHVREAAAIALGDARAKAAIPALAKRLLDDSPRVKLQASIALGKAAAACSPGEPAVAAARDDLLRLATANADRDPFLRHGVVMGLIGCADTPSLGRLRDHADRSVRLATVLALRRLASPEIEPFLDDSDFQVASEAARAVYDVRIEAAFTALARQLDADPPRFPFTRDNSEAILRRAIALNLRSGGEANAERLLRFASIAGYPEDKRIAALECLDAWDAPDRKDPVHYDIWPVPPRSSPGAAAKAFERAQKAGLLARIQGQSDALRERILKLANRLLPPKPTSEHLAIVADLRENENVRLDSLRIVAGREPAEARAAIDVALRSDSPSLRREARERLASLDPDLALPEIAAALRFGTLAERQSAIELLARFFKPVARYLRVDLPGTGRILSLAEVELFSGGQNVARSAKASQSSTDWEGPVDLAIDGSTEGDHSAKPSVSHTAIENDPWLELDLGADFSIDAIEIWNRTDNGHQKRLNGAIVKLLDSGRQEVSRTLIEKGPEASLRIAVGLDPEIEKRALRMLRPLVRRLADGTLDAGLRLEVLEAARATKRPEIEAELAAWRSGILAAEPLGDVSVAQDGGDPGRGSDLFHYHPLAECLRCHAIEGRGGNVGPDLTGVGSRRDRRYLLRSMVEPQAIIAKGFGQISAMPAMGDKISVRQMRDVVSFLAAQTSDGTGPARPLANERNVGAGDHGGGIDRVGIVLMALPALFLAAALVVAFRRGG